MNEELPLCGCGCELRVAKRGNKFIHGHNNRGISLPHRTPEHCAALSEALTGRTLSPDHCAAMSAATKGVPRKPHTPERCAAISKGQRNSDAMKAKAEARRDVPRTPEVCAAISKAKKGVPKTPEQIAATVRGQEEAGVHDAQRGGHDIVKHHFIYDHNDLSLNTVQITRSDHSKLHRLLQKLGYKVPHINVKE